MNQDKLRERLVAVARQRRVREEATAGDPEAWTPLDDGAMARISARVLHELEAPAGAKVLRFRRATAAVVTAVTAMAAALVLFLWPAPLPPLPGYEATFAGETPLRSSASQDGPARVGPDSVFTLVARPRRPVHGPVEAAAFLVRGDSARPWAAPLQVSPEGAVRISGPAGILLPPEPGPWTAVIVLTRPGHARAGAEDALRFLKGDLPATPDLQLTQVRFEQTGP